MSVVFDKVSKSYRQNRVVNAVSFELRPGEITGLLGPNGAGKSTVIKMTTGVLLPDAGKIAVCGYDIVKAPILAKRCIGYLPENNPLYEEMFPKEYLRTMGRLAGLRGRRLSQRTDEVLELVGLGPEAHKKVQTLSKGYRQRVGLAQALIADPEVLILDEPSEGFDPNQLADMRRVIRSLAERKTILLSTHVMQEVEALCDRILLIDGGRIISDTTREHFRLSDASVLRLLLRFKTEVQPEVLKNIPGILRLTRQDRQTWALETDARHDPRPYIFRTAAENGWVIAEIRELNTAPEEVFRHLTEEAKNAPQA